MNILITVSDVIWGGKHTYMYRAGIALRAAGHNVIFCGQSGGDLLRRLNLEQFPSIEVADFESANSAVAKKIMMAALHEHKIDMVIATGRRDYVIAWHALQEGAPAVKFVLVRLSAFPIELYPDYVAACRRADAILLLTNRIIEQQFLSLIAEDKTLLSKFVEFRTTVDSNRFSPRSPAPSILCEFGFSGSEKVICSVARLSWEKDHPTLLRAFAAIQPQQRNVKLLLIGEGEMRSRIIELASDLGITSHLLFAGQRDDLPELLSVCYIHVLASICEETGAISLQEAMAMGVPVVASRIGVIPDYVKHEETGLLFTPGNSEELASCLILLLENPKLHLELARRGRLEIVNRFDEAAQMMRLNRFLVELGKVS